MAAAAAAATSQGPRLLRRISIANRPRPFRVVVLGQMGVGKSALTVRFLTRRFIGEYDPHLEKVYTCTRSVDGDAVVFEVLDTAAQQDEKSVEESIRWADAYILLYSVADRCSLNECLRLKFLVNAYGKRNRKYSVASPEGALSSNPVALVGNQNDRNLDRMVPLPEGVASAAQLGCVAFYEISVRECCDSVQTIFEDLYMCYKRPKKFRAIYPRRSVSECKVPPFPPSSLPPGSGPSGKEEMNGEGKEGRKGESEVKVESPARSKRIGRGSPSPKREAEVKKGQENSGGRRRGALQSIS
ncbi:hypothetical protein V1264_024432 [Littorina saxatilis]|uniref:small monomeric GTPase n=2 Tax=Littorina saxatilis TaxID=31220 RepID=A0AAN9AMX8_9CAEN